MSLFNDFFIVFRAAHIYPSCFVQKFQYDIITFFKCILIVRHEHLELRLRLAQLRLFPNFPDKLAGIGLRWFYWVQPVAFWPFKLWPEKNTLNVLLVMML